MMPKTISIPDDVVLEQDLTFNTNPSRPLKLHLLRPKEAPTHPLPVIVYIFGGAFRMGNKESGLAPLIPFVQQGYIGATIEYRYSSEALFPAQVKDCKCAIRFLRANAEHFQLDPKRIGVWGPSAGGYLVTMLGVSDGVAEFETSDWKGVSSAVNAVCNWFGPTDFLQMNRAGSIQDHDAPDSPESELLGFPIQQYPERLSQTNPMHHIAKAKVIPPFLIIHGDADPLVPFHQSELLYAALRQVQAPVAFLRRIAGAGHGGPEFESDAIRHLMRMFFDLNLRYR